MIKAQYQAQFEDTRKQPEKSPLSNNNKFIFEVQLLNKNEDVASRIFIR